MIVKNLALTAVCALAVAITSPASAIEVFNNSHAVLASTIVRQPVLGVAPGGILLPASQLSELPEPEVFAMMLLGLILIGYRSSRNSDEKFR